MACVELFLKKKCRKMPHLSAAAAYYYMKESARQDVTQPIRTGSPGYTRFKDAVSFLKETGYYCESQWRDRLTEVRPADLVEEGQTIKEVCYHSYPLLEGDKSYPPVGAGRPTGIALAIYRELADGRPVGAGFPAYARPEGHGMTNWTSAFESGIVPIPRVGDELDMEAGHAICIVGFTRLGEVTKADSIVEGYFVFRNSFGEAFACAPVTGWPQGYGLVKAELVEKCCWEVMFMRDQRPDDPRGEA
jgi:hypothetical protein